MKLAIDLEILNKIVKQCINSPIERVFICIGFFDNNMYIVEEIFECKNISLTPSSRFIADPLCLYNIYRYAENKKREIIAIIHSHPMSPIPSREDVNGMNLWRIPWIIIDSLSGEYKAWILIDNNINEISIENKLKEYKISIQDKSNSTNLDII